VYRRQYHAERDLTGLVDRDAVQAQAAGEGAGPADGGGVTEGGFEVGLAEGGQPVDVDRIGTDDPGTPGHGPGVHVPGGVRRPLGVAASGGQQGGGEPSGPGQRVIAVGVAQREPLVDQLLGLARQ
jgi:hypothetical protein